MKDKIKGFYFHIPENYYERYKGWVEDLKKGVEEAHEQYKKEREEERLSNEDRITQMTEALMAIYNYTLWQDRTDSEKLDKIQDICCRVLEHKPPKDCSIQ